jgi:hypothetical protein
VEWYVRLFQELPPERFALIAVDASSLPLCSQSLALHLQFLHTLGLIPVVVTGLFEPYEAAHTAHTLQHALKHVGVPVSHTSLSSQEVLAALTQGRVPLVPLVAPLQDSSFTYRFQQLTQLALALKTRAVILTRPEGGIVEHGRMLTQVNMSACNVGSFPAHLSGLLQGIQRFVTGPHTHRTHVVLTSASHVLQELFTTKGSGTLFRRGIHVLKYTQWQQVDHKRLTLLLESAFGKTLSPHFLPVTSLASSCLYMDEDYRACALLTTTPKGMYLSKFAVSQEAQGDGLGRDIWDSVCQDFACFFWRSRPRNSFNPWYMQQCDGMVRDQDWWVFFKGPLPHDVSGTVDCAKQLPEDFVSESR